MHVIKRAAVAAFLAVGLLGAGGTGTAQAAEGCVGFPEYGGLYYHCMAANTALPRIGTAGSTNVGTTVPAFCYFLGCTSETPVGYTVPVNLTINRPSSDITIFRLQYACYEYYFGRYCGKTYEIVYDAPYTSCYFQTDDPTLAALDGYRFTCQV